MVKSNDQPAISARCLICLNPEQGILRFTVLCHPAGCNEVLLLKKIIKTTQKTTHIIAMVEYLTVILVPRPM